MLVEERQRSGRLGHCRSVGTHIENVEHGVQLPVLRRSEDQWEARQKLQSVEQESVHRQMDLGAQLQPMSIPPMKTAWSA